MYHGLRLESNKVRIRIRIHICIRLQPKISFNLLMLSEWPKADSQFWWNHERKSHFGKIFHEIMKEKATLEKYFMKSWKKKPLWKNISWNHERKSHFGKIFHEIMKEKATLEKYLKDMLFRTLSTTLLQIFCKIILNSKVDIKSSIDPDFLRNS